MISEKVCKVLRLNGFIFNLRKTFKNWIIIPVSQGDVEPETNWRRRTMFHEVRVLSPQGQLKEVIPSNNLSQLFWHSFRQAEDKISLTSTGRGKVPRWVKDKLDMEYAETYDTTMSAS
jgi:hypothetical protein